MTTPELTGYNQLTQELGTLLLAYQRKPTSPTRQTIEVKVRIIKRLYPSAWMRSSVILLCTQTFGSISPEFGTLIANYLLTL